MRQSEGLLDQSFSPALKGAGLSFSGPSGRKSRQDTSLFQATLRVIAPPPEALQRIADVNTLLLDEEL